MFALFSVRTASRLVVGVLIAFIGVMTLSGCEADGYSDGLTYPVRSDWLVVQGMTSELPRDVQLRFDRPGQWPVTLLQNASSVPPTVIDQNLRASLEGDGKKLADPIKVSGEQRGQIESGLRKLFGTPAHPKVAGWESEKLGERLQFDTARLEEGSRLYRRHCLHCHGLAGDGRGPTAPWVNPHPRDYRPGIFKFTSSSQDEGRRKPRVDDLLRTLRQGIEGTSMPSFGQLPESQLEAMASYVIHLSMRGEAEFEVMKVLLANSDLLDPDTGDRVGVEKGLEVYLNAAQQNWKDAQEKKFLITPDPYPYAPGNEEEIKASVQRGYDLFRDPKGAGCIQCHQDYGRASTFRFDAWGTIVRPPDLTRPLYRGGRRPIDIYYRVHSGIRGSGMLSSNKLRPANPAPGKPDSLWDLVNFVQALPYPAMRDKYGIPEEPVAIEEMAEKGK